jgi:hypothetical protein
VPFFVDEYLQVRAAQRILDQGLPLLPSGNFYSHGLVVSYLIAPIVASGTQVLWLIRLPVLVLSTAAIPLAYLTGRRMFSPGAGLVAAALLACAPEAILWGGRVRMYGPLQFFVQLATLVFYVWVVCGRDRPLYRWGFVLAYWAALFSQVEASILLPLWGVWALLQRGLRWCLRPPNLAAFALAGAAILIEIGLRRIGPPVQAWLAPGVFQPAPPQYLGAGLDLPGAWKVLQPLFVTPVRLPLALLAIAGLVWLIVAGVQRVAGSRVNEYETAGRKRMEPVPMRPFGSDSLTPFAYLYFLLLPSLAVLLFGVDPDWKSPRYGLMLLPIFFVLAGGLLAALGRWLQHGLLSWGGRRQAEQAGVARPSLQDEDDTGRSDWALLQDEDETGHSEGSRHDSRAWLPLLALAALVPAIVLGSWTAALAATRETVPDYRWALDYVQERWQPGDVLVTWLCQAGLFEMGRCDYLAIPTDYQGFAFQKDGRWVSGWDEVPILDSADGLRQVLAAAPRVWFVIDEGRFQRRFTPEFVQAVSDGMELAAQDREMLVFRSSR